MAVLMCLCFNRRLPGSAMAWRLAAFGNVWVGFYPGTTPAWAPRGEEEKRVSRYLLATGSCNLFCQSRQTVFWRVPSTTFAPFRSDAMLWSLQYLCVPVITTTCPEIIFTFCPLGRDQTVENAGYNFLDGAFAHEARVEFCLKQQSREHRKNRVERESSAD